MYAVKLLLMWLNITYHDESVTGWVSIVFDYKSSLEMAHFFQIAPLIEQRAVNFVGRKP